MFKYFIEFFTIKEVYSTIITVVLSFLVYSITQKIFERIVIKGKDELDRKRRKTIMHRIQNILKYSYVIILLIIILQIFGVNTRNLIAGLGIAGIIIGLALQDALKDIISGVSIIMDDYFVVGDIVEIKGFKGTVISLGLKATKIQNENGAINILTNRTIDNVINYSKKSPNIKLYITLSNSNKQKTVDKLLNKIVEELKTDHRVKNNAKYLGIEEILDNKIKYAIEVNCLRGHENEIKRLFNEKIKSLYDNEKIEK